MKTLLIFLLMTGVAMAGPNLVSNAQIGVEEHLFECGEYSVVTLAQTDGSFLWDYATWTGGHGWFDCTVKARIKYEATDEATGITTFVIEESDPAGMKNKNFKANT
jgi:hypothetical protein